MHKAHALERRRRASMIATHNKRVHFLFWTCLLEPVSCSAFAFQVLVLGSLSASCHAKPVIKNTLAKENPCGTASNSLRSLSVSCWHSQLTWLALQLMIRKPPPAPSARTAQVQFLDEIGPQPKPRCTGMAWACHSAKSPSSQGTTPPRSA